MNNFKNRVISLNMLHTRGLCGVLGFTALLILISKKFQSTLIAQAATKQLLLGG